MDKANMNGRTVDKQTSSPRKLGFCLRPPAPEIAKTKTYCHCLLSCHVIGEKLF